MPLSANKDVVAECRQVSTVNTLDGVQSVFILNAACVYCYCFVCRHMCQACPQLQAELLATIATNNTTSATALPALGDARSAALLPTGAAGLLGGPVVPGAAHRAVRIRDHTDDDVGRRVRQRRE